MLSLWPLSTVHAIQFAIQNSQAIFDAFKLYKPSHTKLPVTYGGELSQCELLYYSEMGPVHR